MKTFAYWFLNITWGCIMSIIGLFAALFLLVQGIKPKIHKGTFCFVYKNGWGGVCLGPIFIVCEENADWEPSKNHEFGHGIQNMAYGPLFPFIVGLPSLIRAGYRNYLKSKDPDIELPDYYSIWFEGQASEWGEKW